MAKKSTPTEVLEERPSWLRLPATSAPENFPVEGNKQDLPYGDLSWEDYERLCFRLAEDEAEVEYWALFGRQGQAQDGIDIFARKAGGQRYSCWQAKKHKTVTAAKVKALVNEFLKGDWAGKTDRFHACFQAPIQDTKVQKEIETQAALLSARDITFIPVGSVEMSRRLKKRVDLVLDFFGRNWAIAFAGQDAVAKLGQRLDASDITRLRAELLSIYSGSFQTLDPGVGSIPLSGPYRPLSLLDRFVEPDVAHQESLSSVEPSQTSSEPTDSRDAIPGTEQTRSPHRTASRASIRRPISNWVSEGEQTAILAPGGFGKSSFLRALALDLLSEGKLFPELTRRWGDRIPIYLPFATWTRLFSAGSDDVALSDAIQHWFKRFQPSQELLNLIHGSLKDNRLLLLIDGLDEGTNEHASRSARALLDSFIKTHSVDAILTSRPSGIDRLGALDPMWRVGRIAELTKAQQQNLALIWYRHLKPKVAATGTAPNVDTYDLAIRREVDDFFTTLSGRGMLEPLAGIPLLLSGLITLALKQVSLPRSRFEAYDELIKLLLDEHPKRRATAAQQTSARSIILSEAQLVRGAISYLAYKCRESGSTPGIAISEAKKYLVEYLQSMQGAGLPAQTALSAANELLSIDAETTGLLIQRSPDEIGFLHAVFEEHLAGSYASSFDLADQTKLIVEKSGDERWMNVLLSMLRGVRRRNEVESLVRAALSAAVDPVARVLSLRMASEVAFGDFNSPPAFAQEIARDAFKVIETGGWLPERLTLLQIALEAGWNGPVSALLREKIGQWFPDSIRFRSNVYAGMIQWPHDEELKQCLWRGLFCDGLDNKRAASIALSQSFSHEEALANELAALARAPVDPETTAVALLTLQNGWKSHPALSALIDEARKSLSIPLLLTGIRCAIAQKRHTDDDLKVLLDFAKDHRGFHEWSGEVGLALTEGWPNDDRIYKLVSETIRTEMHSGPLDKDVAKRYALDAAQYDDAKDIEVAKAIVKDQFFLRSLGGNHLRPGTYRLNVLDAIDKRIELTDEHFNNDVAQMAVVAKTAAAKERLLKDLHGKDRYIFWPIWGLLEGWGMSDPDVSAALTPLLGKPPEERNLFAHYIPLIEPDPIKARANLVEIANAPKLERLDMLVRGFKKLGVSYADDEIVELLLKHSFAARGVFDATDELISGFGMHPKVRALARERAAEIDCPWASLVESYGNDPEFRGVIFKRLNSLPAVLRGRFVNIASRKTSDDAYLERLSNWGVEDEQEIRVHAAFGYNSAVKLDLAASAKALEYLERETVSIGPWMDQRRQAGLVGMLALGREDVFANLHTPHGKNDLADVGLYYPENRAAIAYVARNWAALKQALGSDVFDRLSKHGANEWHAWQFFAPYISESSAIKEEFIAYCGRETKRLSSQALDALSRVSPRSSLLTEHCKRVFMSAAEDDVNSSSADSERRNIILGQIVARQFSTHAEFETEFKKALPRGNTAAIVGLSLGWPDLPELRNFLTQSMAAEWRGLQVSYVAAIHLASAVGTTDEFKKIFSSLLKNSDAGPWSFLEYCVPPTVSRLKKDAQLAQDSLKAMSSEHSDFKASMPRLLATAIGLTYELRSLCNKELATQYSGRAIPLSGLDIVAGKVRPVSDALMDTLVSASV